MIKSPYNLQYLPYQEEIIYKIAKHPRTMLCLPIGSGKSIIMAGYINLSQPKSVLVLAPVYMLKTLEREFKKWIVHPYHIEILNKKSVVNSIENKILIINYESLKKYKLNRFNFDLLCADECQYVKTFKSQRTQAFQAIKSRDCILATATPIFNRINELFSPFHKLVPRVFNSNWNFVWRYCDAFYKRMGARDILDTSGKSNMDELRQIVRNNHLMLYKKREDILAQLPPVTIQSLELEMKFGDKTWYNKLKEIKDKEEKIAYIEAGKVDISGDSLFTVRKKLGIEKIQHVMKIIPDIIESTDQIVLFCIHREVAEEYAKQLAEYNPCLVHGGLDKDKRQEQIDAFLTDKTKKILIGTMKSMGAGLTLVNSNVVVFGETPFTNADFEQAWGRCHRIGQINPVSVYAYLCPNSIDMEFWELCQDKKELNQEVLDMAE